MERIEIVKYKALDGTMFDSKEDCIEYEDTYCSMLKMWDWNGNETKDVSAATLIYLGDYQHPQGNAFINLADAQGSTSTGIEKSDNPDEADSGWFFWDEFEDRYSWIPDDIIKILKPAFKTI